MAASKEVHLIVKLFVTTGVTMAITAVAASKDGRPPGHKQFAPRVQKASDQDHARLADVVKSDAEQRLHSDLVRESCRCRRGGPLGAAR